ncbi:MAG: right-handed parallel beta-helix repeat-containing protein, partial [Jejuia sp.]
MRKINLHSKPYYLMVLMFLWVLTLVSQNEIHVYSIEMPWSNETVSEDPSKIYSINQAISQATSGDIIVMHEGIYRERLAINKSNLTLKNYNNDYVLVTGADVVNGTWEDAEGMTSGVKVIDISGISMETDYSQLFVNGKIQKLGRHPNRNIDQMMEVIYPNNDGGYAPLINGSKPEGADATGEITFDETTLPNVDLTGGIIRAMTGKMRRYVYGDIVANSGNTVSFKAINNNTDWKAAGAIPTSRFKFSWGYVLHKNLVDTPGEWFIDENKLYYYPKEGEVLEESRVELQTRERVLVLNNTSGTNITGINFVAGNVDAQSTNNTLVDNCSFRYLYPFWTPTGYGQGDTDRKGIYLSNSSNNTFQNTYIGHSWGNMVALRFGQNNTFENCIIEDFGWVGVFTSGIHINRSDNTRISKSTFGEACRFHIRIDGGDAKVDILDSDFYGAMKLGEDAGSLQGTSTGRIGSIDLKGSEIAYNKVHDVKGLPVSDGNYNKAKIVAFYMEDIENYTAHHNLIYNFKADNYNGSVEIEEVGEFLYLGPRYNRMQNPVNYYNNTVWNYDEFCSVWNIEIDNWEELGLAEEDASGSMEDGHFANNVFINQSVYRLSYVRQVLSPTGGNLGWVSLNPSPSLNTQDWDQYTAHCANYNYKFNPQNNVLLDFSSQSNNFVDAANGNFTLLSNSPAKNAGIAIPGITSSTNPDCGALEGSDRVLNAGAELIEPIFLEETSSVLDAQFAIAVTSETCPDTNNGTLSIIANRAADYELTFDNQDYTFDKEKSFEGLTPGTYQLCISTKNRSDEQCFMIEVTEASSITTKTKLNQKDLNVTVTSGTAPFNVYVNDVKVFNTNLTSFSVPVSQGDVVKVKSDKACEGELIQSIDFYAN